MKRYNGYQTQDESKNLQKRNQTKLISLLGSKYLKKRNKESFLANLAHKLKYLALNQM